MKQILFKIFLLLLLLISIILIISTNFHNAFIYDGGTYLKQMNILLKSFQTNSVTLDKFFFVKHFSAGYVLLLLLVNNLFNDINLTINITCLLLFLAGLTSFYFIVVKLFNKKWFATENILITSILAFNPIVLAAAITFNIDFPVFVFYLIFLSALFYQKDFLFILSAFMLVFSKETGALMLGITFGGMIVLFLYEYKTNKKFSYKLRYLIYSALPFLVLFAYFIYKYFTQTNILFKAGDFRGGGFGFFFDFNFSDGITLIRFFQFYVINFKWITVLFILIYIGKNRQSFAKEISFKKNYNTLFILIIPYFVFIYFNLMYRTYVNPRYLILNDIFMPLFLFYILEKYVKFSVLKKILLSLILFLNIISIYNTADPFSKIFFKTFKIGNKKLISMNSHRGIPSHGRDELSYNLQYFKIHELCQKFVSKYNIDDNDKVIVPCGGDFNLFEDNNNLFESNKINIIDIAKKYDRHFYVDLPNLDIHNQDLKIIKKYYSIKNKLKIKIGEYTINIFRIFPKFNLKSKVFYKINNTAWGNLKEIKKTKKQKLYLKIKNFIKTDILSFGVFSDSFKIPKNYALDLSFTPFFPQIINSFLLIKENELYITNVNNNSMIRILFGDGKRYFTRVDIPVIINKLNNIKIIKKNNKVSIFRNKKKYIEANFSKFRAKSYRYNRFVLLNSKYQRVFFNGVINELSISEF